MPNYNIPKKFSVENGYIAYAIGSWLKQEGYKVDSNVSTAQLHSGNAMFFDVKHLLLRCNNDICSWEASGIVADPHFSSLKQFIKYVKPQPIEVQLNSDYSATYIKGSQQVTVGCQEIPISAILKLADLIRSE